MWPVWANAISDFDVGTQERIQPSHHRGSVLETLCNRQLSWAKATAIGSWIVRSRVAPYLSHAAVAEAVLGAQSRAAQWQSALAVLRGLGTHGGGQRCTSAAITALARSESNAWPRAKALLATATTCDSIMYNAAIHTCRPVWIEAVGLCSGMEQRGLRPDIVSLNTLSRHMSWQAAWQVALASLDILKSRSHRPDTVSYSNAMSSQDWNRAAGLFSTMCSSLPSRPVGMSLGSLFAALRTSPEWERALSFCRLMPPDASMINTIGSMATKATASLQSWRAGLRMLIEMPSRQLQRDTLTRSLLHELQLSSWRQGLAFSLSEPRPRVSKSDVGFAFGEAPGPGPQALSWERALRKLRAGSREASAPATAAALTLALRGLSSLADRADRADRRRSVLACFELLEDFGEAVDVCTYLWCLATLVRLSPTSRDPEALQGVHREVGRAIAKEGLSCHELAVVAWSFCMLGLRSEGGALAGGFCLLSQLQLEAFNDRDLMLLAWVLGATATDSPESVKELQAVQEDMCRRLELLELPMTLRHMPIKSLRGLLRDALGALWSYSRCSLTSSRFREVLQRKLKGLGGLLDGSPSGASCVTPPRQRSKRERAGPAGRLQRVGWYQDAGGPRIKADLPECWVVFKPCGWEVHNRNVENQVASCLQIHGKPITFDSSHDFGFLHRLDVPSSGLLLAAKSYEAFYNFKFQLAAGMITREYTALCHGILPQSSREIRAGIFWDSSLGPTRSGGAGKPSCTCLAVTRSFWKGPLTFSLAVILIDSGRRHQIRSHCAHVGHPIVCDAKYASAKAWREDARLCSRHFLHRSRLKFFVNTAAEAAVAESFEEPLPLELVACLETLEGFHAEWMQPGATEGWAAAVEHLANFKQRRCQRSTAVVCSVALADLARRRGWHQAASLLKLIRARTIAVDEFSYNSGIFACRHVATWSHAVAGLLTMETERLEPDACTCHALVSAYESGSRWQSSLRCLELPFSSRSGLACSNAMLSACAKARRWLQALHRLFLQPMTDVISWNVVISALGKGGWKVALGCLQACRRSFVEPDAGTHNLITVACKGKEAWQRALLWGGGSPSAVTAAATTGRIEAMRHGGVSTWPLCLSALLETSSDPVLVSAALGNLALAGRLNDFEDLLEKEKPGLDPPLRLWALAKLAVLAQLSPSARRSPQPERLLGALAEAQEDGSAPEAGTKTLTRLWWALSVLQASSPRFDKALAARSLERLEDFPDKELMLVAWAVSGKGPLLQVSVLRAIQAELLRRIARTSSVVLSPELVRCILGVVWSCSFSSGLMEGFYMVAWRALCRHGRGLDKGQKGTGAPAGASLSNATFSPVGVEAPRVVLDLSETLAILKPPGWEVHDESADARETQQLLQYVRSLVGQQRMPILQDPACNFGFLHRLDVPSSGLILAAKSFKSYFDLQAQLASGRLLRDYVVLCHGLISAKLTIEAPLSWLSDASDALGPTPTRSGAFGKPARTELTRVRAVHSCKGSSFGFCKIRIRTGRRHQIRSHLAYVGFPVVCDGKYTAQETFERDCFWFPRKRNALHRFRVSFREGGLGTCCAVTEPPGEDFRKALDQIAWDDVLNS
ncbi:rluD [Symbiodinium sp. CCMP2456]|nr:rluD [Symbiodinium sp. CCMP2456]